jgi:type II secretory pathway pseudopilin PulG
MDDFLKMDIFFGVTTVAVVVVSVLLTMVLIRLLRILKTADEVSEIIQGEAEGIRDDIREVRATVKRETVKVGQLLSLLTGLAKPKRRTKKESSS